MAQSAIKKELLSRLAMMDEKHQEKVLAYIKVWLDSDLDEEEEMRNRAEAAESDIAAGRFKELASFRSQFQLWQKKKRNDLKL